MQSASWPKTNQRGYPIGECAFIEDMRFIGDTAGNDLPGDGGDNRAQLQIKFKS